MSQPLDRYLELRRMDAAAVRAAAERHGFAPPRSKRAAIHRVLEKETGVKIRPATKILR